jgi:hypothetical protein
MRGLASVSREPFGRVYGSVVAIELAIRFLRSRAQVRLRQHALTPAAELPRVLVRTGVDLPVSGCTSWQNGRWLIVLNGAEPLVRQRFSLAHEFKHAVAHRFRHELYFGRPGLSATTQAEYAADYFAACLLMPKRWLYRAWAAGRQQVSDLSQLFAVSPQGVRTRIRRPPGRALVAGSKPEPSRSAPDRRSPPTPLRRRSGPFRCGDSGAMAG